MTPNEHPHVFPAILARALRRRLQAKQPSNILTSCGVGTVRSHLEADGSFRGKECYTTVAYPARMDRWPECTLGQRSFFCEQST
jgi:hypothetical protein